MSVNDRDAGETLGRDHPPRTGRGRSRHNQTDLITYQRAFVECCVQISQTGLALPTHAMCKCEQEMQPLPLKLISPQVRPGKAFKGAAWVCPAGPAGCKFYQPAVYQRNLKEYDYKYPAMELSPEQRREVEIRVATRSAANQGPWQRWPNAKVSSKAPPKAAPKAPHMAASKGAPKAAPKAPPKAASKVPSKAQAAPPIRSSPPPARADPARPPRKGAWVGAAHPSPPVAKPAAKAARFGTFIPGPGMLLGGAPTGKSRLVNEGNAAGSGRLVSSRSASGCQGTGKAYLATLCFLRFLVILGQGS